MRSPLAQRVAHCFARAGGRSASVSPSVAWCLHVAALSMAPLSLVQAVIAGGLAMLAIPARRWFGIAVGSASWSAWCSAPPGSRFLALTAGHGRPGGGFTSSTMLAFEGGTLALGGPLMLASAHRARSAHTAGCSWPSAAGHAARSLGRRAQGPGRDGPGTAPAAPCSALGPRVAILGGLGAFLALARGLQLGEPVGVIVVFSAAATLRGDRRRDPRLRRPVGLRPAHGRRPLVGLPGRDRAPPRCCRSSRRSLWLRHARLERCGSPWAAA